MNDDRMSEKERRNRTLGDLLRQADPAGDGHSLDANEVAQWREETLRAARQSPRAAFLGGGGRAIPWLQPLAVTVAAGAIIVAGILYVAQRGAVRETAQVQSARPPTAALSSAPLSVADDTTPASAGQAGSRLASATEPAAAVAPVSPTVIPGVRSATPSPSAAIAAGASRSTRAIQFQAPGGTRIIWTLDPDFRMSGT